jgi:hypothetical protein
MSVQNPFLAVKHDDLNYDSFPTEMGKGNAQGSLAAKAPTTDGLKSQASHGEDEFMS